MEAREGLWEGVGTSKESRNLKFEVMDNPGLC